MEVGLALPGKNKPLPVVFQIPVFEKPVTLPLSVRDCELVQTTAFGPGLTDDGFTKLTVRVSHLSMQPCNGPELVNVSVIVPAIRSAGAGV